MATEQEYDLIASAVLSESIRKDHDEFFTIHDQPKFDKLITELKNIKISISNYRKTLRQRPPNGQGVTL